MIEWILAASGLSVLASLSGVVFFSRFSQIKEHISALISLSVGAFLAVAFIDLIPEALELSGGSGPFYILGGFLGFVLISYFVSVYHHHHGDELCEDCDPELHRAGFLILLGDFAHNFVDGIVITAGFLVNPAAGIAITAGVLLHEIPQEVAEFFVLIRAGYERKRALFLNFLVSFSVVLGAVIAYFFTTIVSGSIGPILGIAAGNLIYIAAADLLPDLFSQKDRVSGHGQFIKHFSLLLLGVVLIIGILQAGEALNTHSPLEETESHVLDDMIGNYSSDSNEKSAFFHPASPSS